MIIVDEDYEMSSIEKCVDVFFLCCSNPFTTICVTHYIQLKT